jgi:hypothetical protein
MPLETKKPVDESKTSHDIEELVDSVVGKTDYSLTKSDARLRQIELRLQEIDFLCEQLEVKIEEAKYEIIGTGIDTLEEEYSNYEVEYKLLVAEKKAIIKESRAQNKANGGFWNTVPLWIFLIAIVHLVLSFYLVLPMLSANIAIALNGKNGSDVRVIVLSFLLPLFLFALAGIIFVFIRKNKKLTKYYLIIFIIEMLNLIPSVIYLIVTLLSVFK